jgi:hypothetical protein
VCQTLSTKKADNKRIDVAGEGKGKTNTQIGQRESGLRSLINDTRPSRMDGASGGCIWEDAKAVLRLIGRDWLLRELNATRKSALSVSCEEMVLFATDPSEFVCRGSAEKSPENFPRRRTVSI